MISRGIHGLFLVTVMVSGTLFSLASVGIASAQSVDDRIQKLERQLEGIRHEVKETHYPDLKVLEERLNRLERARPASEGGEIGNMVFFRGGGAWATSDRSNEVFTDVFGQGGTFNGGDSGYYVGAGLDLVLSKNVWGTMTATWVLGEIGVEFKRFNSKNVTVAVPTTCFALGGTAPGCSLRKDEVQITMLTVNIAPKIMFREGHDFRPWIIPIGLDFHVISPPSNDTTVLDIGAQFAIGGQYRIWKAFHLGVDGRFHLATGQTDTTNNFGTVGGYVGIAF